MLAQANIRLLVCQRSCHTASATHLWGIIAIAVPQALTIAVIYGLWRGRALPLRGYLEVIVEDLSVDLVQLIVELSDLWITRVGPAGQG